MAVDTVYRVAFEGRLGYGDQAVTTLHYRVAETSVATIQEEMEVLLADIEANLVPDFLATFASSAVLDRIVARTVQGPPQGAETNIGDTGSRTGDPLPQQLSAEILWRTPLLGRRYSGKQKLWPPVETDIAAATWTAGYLTSLEGYAETAMAQRGSGGTLFDRVVWSEKFSFANPVTAFRVVQDPRTQATRTPGRGG